MCLLFVFFLQMISINLSAARSLVIENVLMFVLDEYLVKLMILHSYDTILII